MSFLLKAAGLRRMGGFGGKDGKDNARDKGKGPGDLKGKKDIIRDLFGEKPGPQDAKKSLWEKAQKKPYDVLRGKSRAYSQYDKIQKEYPDANDPESPSSADKNSDNSRKGFFSRKRLLNLLYAPTSAKEFAMYEAYNNGQENVANIGDRISGGVEKVLSQGGGDAGRVLGAASDNSADNNSTMPFMGWGGQMRGMDSRVSTKIKGTGDRILGQGRGREIRKPGSGSSEKGKFQKEIKSGSRETLWKHQGSNRRTWPTEDELVGSGSGDFREY